MDQEIFKEKSWKKGYGFGIVVDNKVGKAVTTGSGNFKMSLRHKNADRCQRRQVDILISSS